MFNQNLIDDIIITKCDICNTEINIPKDILFYLNSGRIFLEGYTCNCARSFFGICNLNEIFSLCIRNKFSIGVNHKYFSFIIYKFSKIKVIDENLDLTQFDSVFELENYLNKYYELDVFE